MVSNNGVTTVIEKHGGNLVIENDEKQAKK